MVFKGLNIHIARFHSQSRTGGGLIREEKIPVQELWLKVRRGLYARGGIFAGHYGNYEQECSKGCILGHIYMYSGPSISI